MSWRSLHPSPARVVRKWRFMFHEPQVLQFVAGGAGSELVVPGRPTGNELRLTKVCAGRSDVLDRRRAEKDQESGPSDDSRTEGQCEPEGRTVLARHAQTLVQNDDHQEPAQAEPKKEVKVAAHPVRLPQAVGPFQGLDSSTLGARRTVPHSIRARSSPDRHRGGSGAEASRAGGSRSGVRGGTLFRVEVEYSLVPTRLKAILGDRALRESGRLTWRKK